MTDTRTLNTYRKDLQTWASTIEWSHFGTLTTPYHLTSKSALRLVERTTSNWRSICPNLHGLWTIEVNPDRSGHHVHLIANLGPITPHQYTSLLQGYANASGKPQSRIQLERYDPFRAGASYILKDVTPQADNWGIF